MNAEKTIERLLLKLGEDCSFVEVGVLRGTTIVHVAEHCPNVSAVIGVDFFKPYVDTMQGPGTGGYSVNSQTANLNREITLQKIRNSTRADVIKLIIEDCADAAKQFEDESVNCIFLDAYMNEKDVIEHIAIWRPKVKKGGFLLGHDINTISVQNGLEKAGIPYKKLDNNVWRHRVS